jgi:hypothetical protein
MLSKLLDQHPQAVLGIDIAGKPRFGDDSGRSIGKTASEPS